MNLKRLQLQALRQDNPLRDLPCPKCGRVPKFIVGIATVADTELTLPTYQVSCCGFSSNRYVGQSSAKLSWMRAICVPVS